MTDIKEKGQGTIRVADITIAQLSRGLYRSTATAFKELVSNSYDADATVVRIDTNYPEFDFISCVDDGTGMALEDFLRYFSSEGIGTCIKRKHQRDTTEIYGRPIIGRLGIGMLAVGQLCHSFEIESHYEDKNDGRKKAYHAEIVLSDITIPDKEGTLRSDDIETREIDIGLWEYEIIDYEEAKKGFHIYSSDVRNTFRREMKSSVDGKTRKKMSFNLSDLYSEFYDKSRSIRDCQPYLETIWELATLCPLPYYGDKEKYPIDLKSFTPEEEKTDEFEQARQLIEERQSRFLSYNFRVVLDGIELRRHVQLPTDRDVIPRLYFIEFDDIVFDSRLRFSGYLFAQIPKAIRPFELNGVQIRLRGVGIGGYDSTYLRYSKEIETIRSRWVSGEIFVDQGLEGALNIDRDSFNEHDEHFKRLQSVLHDKLNKVFDKIDAIGRVRSEKKRDEKEWKLRKSMQAIIAGESGGKLKLVQQDLEEEAPVVVIHEDKGEIVLNTASRPLRKKKGDMIIRAVMLAYHSVKRLAETEEERDDKFYQLVKKVLKELV
jgi:hypothetical protein